MTSVVMEEIPDRVSLAVDISHCRGNCEGCHSPFLKEDIGEELTEGLIDKLIDDNFGVDTFLFLGEGRDPEALLRLAAHVRERGLSPALYSGEEDPRLTKVGRFLRTHHLDELPQLWNVLVGDMAFVGYRPERKFYIDQIMKEDPRYVFLYQIRPGVTSYATLYNGYTDTMEKMMRRLELDLYYLGHRSWWFDIKILWITFLSIIFGKKF